MGRRTRIGARTVAVALWGLLMVGANLGQTAPVRGAGAHRLAVAALTSTDLPTVASSATVPATVTVTGTSSAAPLSGSATATVSMTAYPTLTTTTIIPSTTPTATMTLTATPTAIATLPTGSVSPATVTSTPMTMTATTPVTATTTVAATTTATTATPTPLSPTVAASGTAPYGTLPLSFEPNRGQTDPQVAYLARGHGYTLFLTGTGATLALASYQQAASQGLIKAPLGSLVPPLDTTLPLTASFAVTQTALSFSWVGANPLAQIVGQAPLSGTVNYDIGSDPSRWLAGIPTFARVSYTGVYPGVDLSYDGSQGQLEDTWTVAPGTLPSLIALAVTGAQGLGVDAQGNLVVHTGLGDITESAPVAYQDIDGQRHTVAARYALLGGGAVGFTLGAYDVSQPLVIDPVLRYGTYLGGSGTDVGNGIAVDASGDAFITGSTASSTFPRTIGTYQGSQDAFVTELNPTGTAVVYSTVLGGNMSSGATKIALDGSGDAFITGSTTAGNFPLVNAAQTSGPQGTSVTGFVTELNATGQLAYSTYLGGSQNSQGNGIAVDGSGAAYVSGYTNCSDFPQTSGSYSQTHGGYKGGAEDGFITKVNPAGGSWVYSTLLGGSDEDDLYGVAVDGSGDAYVTGKTTSSDFPTTPGAYSTAAPHGSAFVSELSPDGSGLRYSTYIGGSATDRGVGIAVDASGAVYVTGASNSANFPTTPGAPQPSNPTGDTRGIVFKLNPLGQGSADLVWSTYLGGSGGDSGLAIAVDATGTAYVTGYTYSGDFPITPNAPQTTLPAGAGDIFVTRVAADGRSFLYSTYLGGSGINAGNGIAVDTLGGAYVTGSANSTTFPATGLYTSNAGGTDAFVAKIDPAPVAVTTVDDSMQGAGFNQFIYVGSWIHCSGPPNGPNCSPLYYNGTNSADDSTGDYATLQFSGSGIRYYATSDSNRGIAAVSVDGGPETLVDLYGPQQGNVLAYTSPPLANGTHILKVRVTGANNPASSNTYVTIDRVDITAPTTRVVAIASGSATGANPYSADGYYSGGSTYATSNAIATSGVSDPAPMSVYQSERNAGGTGAFTYTVPNLVPSASYTVRLHFAETYWTGSGQREFDAFINGQQVLNNFDIYATAGGPNKAIVEAFSTAADGNGQITIAFTTIIDNAKIDGIEVLANVAINSGGGIAGRFVPDVDYSGTGAGTFANGNVINTKAVTNSAPAAVYQSERNGNFSYVVPDLIPGLAYKVRLHFAEIYWSSVGQRVFDVAINGTPVLQRFDIIAAAGAPNTAIVKEFTATADNNGQITIVYTSDTDRAKSSGIEVIAPGQVPDPPEPPTPTQSRYMGSVDPNTFKNLGCTLSNENGVIILDFGEPGVDTVQGQVVYGSILFDQNSTFVTINQIEPAVEAFLNGYYKCSSGARVRLIVGTNNYGGKSAPYNLGAFASAQTITGHGQAWAQMINDLNNYIASSGYGGREAVNGGSDMELGYNTYAHTVAWAKAYDQSAGYFYYDFGDSAGSPTTDTYATTQASPGRSWSVLDPSMMGSISWNQDEERDISWGIKSALPLPEIYLYPPTGNPQGNTPQQANQWEDLSLYSAKNYGYQLYFEGELTEYRDDVNMGICQPAPQPCTENTPAQGWMQLYQALKSDPHTVQNQLNSSIDISHV